MQITLCSRLFMLHKLGNRPNEIEDVASAMLTESVLDTNPIKFATADGATTGAFAHEWAERLVCCVMAEWHVGVSFASLARSLRPAWEQEILSRPLPWFAEAKARAGAFATLLALEIEPPEAGETTGRWRATAVGDTCLFQIHDDRCMVAFPLARADDFSNAPALLASNPSYPESVEAQIEGEWHGNDCLLVMTDALAEWFLRQQEHGKHPWDEIAAWAESEDAADRFPAWIAELRAAHTLRNDDVTLYIIEIAIHDSTTAPS